MDAEVAEKLRRQIGHLIYCEKVALVLCRRSGVVEGWSWRARDRRPPLPFWERGTRPGFCRICGQPIYGGASFRKFAGDQSKRLTWHSVCTTAYFLWMKPGEYAAALAFRQGFVCPSSGAPLRYPIRGIEVDHDIPIYRVRRDYADRPWFDLLKYWGSGNLRALTREAHLAKCAAEAAERAGHRAGPTLFEAANG